MDVRDGDRVVPDVGWSILSFPDRDLFTYTELNSSFDEGLLSLRDHDGNLSGEIGACWPRSMAFLTAYCTPGEHALAKRQ
jgi:hypothetical protein